MAKTFTCRFFDDSTGDLAFEYSGIPEARLALIAEVVKKNRGTIKAAGDVWNAAEAVKGAIAEVSRAFGVPSRPQPARGRR